MRDDGVRTLHAKVPLWWLRALKGKENALKVLVCLSAHANRHFESWPSAERIADLTDIRRDRVFAALRDLRAAGLIETQRRHKHPSVHVIRFAVPFDGTQDDAPAVPFIGTRQSENEVPGSGTHDGARSVPVAGTSETVPVGGTFTVENVDKSTNPVPASGPSASSKVPFAGAMSTVQRVDEYRQTVPELDHELDLEQRESARRRAPAHTREEKNTTESDEDARVADLWVALRPLMSLTVESLSALDSVILADYLAARFMACSAHPKLTGQLADMARDAKYRSTSVHRLVYAARDAFNARGRQESLWDLKAWLRRSA